MLSPALKAPVATKLPAFPKWIPQIGMTIGVVLLFIAFVDDLVCMLRGGTPSYNASIPGNPQDGLTAYE